MSKHRETGHMVERSPGKWSIVLSVKDATTGKRKRQWHSFQGTRREAADERIKLLAAVNAGTAIESRARRPWPNTWTNGCATSGRPSLRALANAMPRSSPSISCPRWATRY
jgi:hypothetical protein